MNSLATAILLGKCWMEQCNLEVYTWKIVKPEEEDGGAIGEC